jgi:hypothetical protein
MQELLAKVGYLLCDPGQLCLGFLPVIGTELLAVQRFIGSFILLLLSLDIVLWIGNRAITVDGLEPGVAFFSSPFANSSKEIIISGYAFAFPGIFPISKCFISKMSTGIQRQG